MQVDARRRSRSCALWLVLLAAIPLASGCGFRTLRRGVEYAGAMAGLEGHASSRSATAAPIIVVVYRAPDGPIADLFMLPRAGPFFFALPAGTYRLAAFEDRNRDLVYEPKTEPAVMFGAPSDVVLGAGERRADCDLVVDPAAGARLPFDVRAVTADGRQAAFKPELQQALGTVTTIDDPRFSYENGQLGLWDPLRFLSEVGAGIYFLEPYDPKRLPVLFVHGATGHPAEWTYLIEHLDRRRFQPWVLYYPSAAHLDVAARWLARALGALQVKHGFTDLIVVAHSMGGLVSRAAINYATGNFTPGVDRLVHVPAFVTLSTPWNGHAAAAQGVKHAPTAAPSWEDMAPDSPFLSGLPKTALPPECEFSMFFSYAGGSKLGEANDGGVTISSQLSMPIQQQAVRLVGFGESHRSILKSAEVSAQLNAILEAAAARAAGGDHASAR